MKNITRLFVRRWALRLISGAALALIFFMLGSSLLYAASEDVVPSMSSYNDTLTGYMTRMILAVVLLGAVGYATAKFLPKFFRTGPPGCLRVLSALNLGRDMVYILQTGPDVIALFVGKSGSTLLGRWSLDEWEDYEAARDEKAYDDLTTKSGG
jgi:hypothetical protein